eukprot:5452219-Prymnesium_polylepis.1
MPHTLHAYTCGPWWGLVSGVYKLSHARIVASGMISTTGGRKIPTRGQTVNERPPPAPKRPPGAPH